MMSVQVKALRGVGILLLASCGLGWWLLGQARAQDAPLAPSSVANPIDRQAAAMRRLGGRFFAAGRHPSWSPDGGQLVWDDGEGLILAEVSSRQRRRLAKPGGTAAWSPVAGGPIAYVRMDGKEKTVCLVYPDGGDSRPIAAGQRPRWAGDGQTLYFSAGDENSEEGATLMSVRVDHDETSPKELLRVSGRMPVLSPRGGQVAYWADQMLCVVDRDQGETVCRFPMVEVTEDWICWSPDAKRLAFGAVGSDRMAALWVLDVASKRAVHAPLGPCPSAAWSPDGERLALEIIAPGGSEVWIVDAQALDALPLMAVATPRYVDPTAAAELVGPWYRLQGQAVTVNLQGHANRRLDEPAGRAEKNHLKELSPGETVLAGVPFEIGEGLVQLGSQREPESPEVVSDIQVGCRVIRLYLLHAAQWAGPRFEVPTGTRIGEYRIRYADGSDAQVPIVVGEDVHDWWARPGQRAKRAQVVWIGQNPAVREYRTVPTYLRLFLGVWENPHPERLVAAVDYRSAMTAAGPFCVAITAEAPQRPSTLNDSATARPSKAQ